MAASGLSTLGITLWAAESTDGSKVTEASKYSQLTRINAIGELSIENESIDSSALEDLISKFVAGRGSVSDSYPITINVTPETIGQWEKLLGKMVCFMTKVPNLGKSIFVIATVPAQLPAPSLDQNSLLTAEINCTTNDFIGYGDEIEVTSAA